MTLFKRLVPVAFAVLAAAGPARALDIDVTSFKLDNGMELTSITAWKQAKTNFQFDSDQTPFNFFSYNGANQKYDQYSQELRLALPTGNALTGQFGLYYYRSVGNSSGSSTKGKPKFLPISERQIAFQRGSAWRGKVPSSSHLACMPRPL